MTLAELNALMVIGVSRTDLTVAGKYTAFLNEAQREICKLRSWKWMTSSADLTIPAGVSYVALPANFKELTKARSPIVQVDSSVIPEVVTPVEIWTLEKQQRRALTAPFLTVRLDFTTSPPRIALLTPLSTNVNLRVSYYAFPADLAADGDTNQLTIEHPHMLLNKAKELAFASVNDPAAVEFNGLFLQQFKQNFGYDSYARLSGTAQRM